MLLSYAGIVGVALMFGRKALPPAPTARHSPARLIPAGFCLAALAWLVAAAPPARRGETIGAAMGASIFGALFGPVVGAVTSFVGTGLAFGSVAVLAAGLAVWALRTPSFAPQEPQPVSRLFAAAKDIQIAAAIWFVAIPALLFGTLNVLAPLRLSALGLSTLAIGAVWLVSALFEALMAPAIGRFSDRRGRLVPLRAGSGTRLKALEAMASSRPLAGTTIGLEGLGLADGKSAVIRDDPDELAAGIARLLTDDDAAERQRAAAHALAADFDWDVIVDRYLSALGQEVRR